MIWLWPCSWFQVFCSVLVKQVPEEIFSVEKIVVTLSLDCLSVVMFSDCLTWDRGWDPFSAGACAAHDGDNTRERHPSQLRPGSRVRGRLRGCPTNPRSEGRSSPPVGGAPPGWSIRRDQRPEAPWWSVATWFYCISGCVRRLASFQRFTSPKEWSRERFLN